MVVKQTTPSKSQKDSHAEAEHWYSDGPHHHSGPRARPSSGSGSGTEQRPLLAGSLREDGKQMEEKITHFKNNLCIL